MASDDRSEIDPVTFEQMLRSEPWKHGFFNVLRRFECLNPNRPRHGESLRASEDCLRLGQEPSMAFAQSTLSAFQPRSADRKLPRLEVLFLGLFGPNGPLPLHLTEYARQQLRNEDDATFARFADIFHDRILALFYRAWAQAQPAVSFDRPDSDRFATYIGSMFGIGTSSMRRRDEVPDLAKLHFSGHLSGTSRHAEGLESILSAFFGVAVELQQFVGQWMTLPEDCRCRLGDSPSTGTLGSTAIVGSRMWECQQTFTLRFGPMTLKDYERLLPGGHSLGRLIAWVRNYVGHELLWKVNLTLRREEVPATRLGMGGRLGWTTWLHSGVPQEDVSDLLLDPVALAG